MIGTTRAQVSFFMNKFRELGFIEYSGGGIEIHSSLLNVVLQPTSESMITDPSGLGGVAIGPADVLNYLLKTSRGADMNDENNGGPVVSNKPLHSPQSAILAIVNMINYLLPEVVLADSNAGGGHDQCLAPRRCANQRQLRLAVTSLCERRGAEICNGPDGVGQRNCDRTTE